MLSVEQVSVVFGGVIANNNISFRVEQGEVYGIIGPNGAGKTTLFNAVGGIQKPNAGKIILCGEEIQGKEPDVIARKGLRRTYQNINLFKKMTVLENVLVGCHVASSIGVLDAVFATKRAKEERERMISQCRDALKFMEIAHLENDISGSLPYGDQRRLEITRALVGQPKVLLLDEPAAGMNPAEKERLAETILKLQNMGHTILLVEHNMKLVMKVCNHICVLNHGNKLAEGKPEEIQNNEEVIRAYLGGKNERHS